MHSKLKETLDRLSSCAGSFYTYAPNLHIRREGESPLWCWEDQDPRDGSSVSYSDLSPDGSRHLHYATGSPGELCELISQRKLWDRLTLLWCGDRFSSGDYGGDLVYASNLAVFLEDHGEKIGVKELHGGYGSSGLGLDVRYISEEMLQAIESLESYPVLDEDHLSHLEVEKEGEAWECWARSDFSRYLEKRLCDLLEDEDRAEEITEKLTEEKLWELLRSGMDSGNLYWETETTSRWLDVEKVVESIPLRDLEALA
jgi:hypothetical protein